VCCTDEGEEGSEDDEGVCYINAFNFNSGEELQTFDFEVISFYAWSLSVVVFSLLASKIVCHVRVWWQDSEDGAEGHKEGDEGEEGSDEDGISAFYYFSFYL